MSPRAFGKRLVVTLALGLSLLTCMAVCVLWARSYRTPPNQVAGRDVFNITRGEPMYWFISNPGRLTLCRQQGRNWDFPLREQKFLGVRFGGRWGADGSLLWNLNVPYWLLASVTGAPVPLAAWRHIRRWRRARRASRLGLCPRCGYDLRGSAGRCPECGVGADVTAT